MPLPAPNKTRGACNGMAVPDTMIVKHIMYGALVRSYRVNRLAHPGQQWYRRVHIRHVNYRNLHYPPCFNGRKNNMSFNVYILFFCAVAKLRNATVSFRCVCPSARNNSAPTGRIFIKFDISIFRKSFENIQVSLKSGKYSGYWTWRQI